jgi:hypothetical protein
VPRADHEPSQFSDNEYDMWTPTYRSPSLFCPVTSSRTIQQADEPVVPPSGPAKTFADMARRFCLKNNEADGEQPALSSASLPGVIKLQPIRKTGHSRWRSMQGTDLCEAYGTGLDNVSTSSTSENMEHLLSMRKPASFAFLTSPKNNVSYHPVTGCGETSCRSQHQIPLVSRTNTVYRPSTLVETGQQDNTIGTHIDVNSQYTELFGKLPDPIRLHEQLGEFDGQVVFIGHPNRDVSAHQWSLASFQWENIGRYAHSRGKIEGSLASDRVKDLDSSHNALVYFKFAAENREKLVVESGRTEDNATDTVLSTHADVLHTTTTYNVSRSVAKDVSHYTYGNIASGQSFGEVTTPASVVSKTVKEEHLDDPFVAKTIPPEMDVSVRVPSIIKLVDVKGSLDLEYKFPAGSSTPSRLPIKHTANAASPERLQGEHRDASLIRSGTRPYGQLAGISLREIGFGEEAASGLEFSFRQTTGSHRVPFLSSLHHIEQRLKLKDRAFVGGEQMKHPYDAVQVGAPSHGRIAVPRFGGPQPTARSLFPAMGMTVANPRRIISHLDTVVSAQPVPIVSSQGLDSQITVADLTSTAGLLFSDPDGYRQSQEYEIANGLSQQAPTVQNFKGPFFTESKPTSHDPTAALSVHVSDEEKLRNWFHDGQRPARQREYAMTLVSAAATSRRDRCLGAIGKMTGATHKSLTENTTPFVRLYEGLSEYVEENRDGSGGSYFSRAWKAAPLHLRDFGLDGNNSYFSSKAY